MDEIKFIECPRDAWQGLRKVIPTEAKVAYLRKLIDLGFRHLDAVSFVSPKHVPQMADSEGVMAGLRASGVLGPVATRANGHDRSGGAAEEPVEVIGIVVNGEGLTRAVESPGVSTLGYPYSVSANFRRQNANMSQSESKALVSDIQAAARARGINVVVYISMAFGNAFGEPWSAEVTAETVEWLAKSGVGAISLADTVGVATPDEIAHVYRECLPAAGGAELGAHLHGRPENAAEKVLAAFEAGCRRFDGALTGLGGCPFAGDQLVGNIPTEAALPALAAKGAATGIEPWALLSAVEATRALREAYA